MQGEMAARSALLSLLARLDARNADDTLVDYLCTILKDAADDSSDTEALIDQTRDLLAEVAPAFARHTSAQQTTLVLGLFEAAQTGATGEQSTNPTSSSSASHGSSRTCSAEGITAGSLVASLRQLELEAQAAGGGPTARSTNRLARVSSSGLGGGSDGAGGGEGAVDDGDEDSLENAEPVALAALRELCQGAASDQFLSYVLARRCCGDPEAAATWLVEQEDVARAEEAWQHQREEERAEAQRSKRERQKSKQAILSRFAFQAVSEPSDGKKERPLEAWTAGKQQAKATGKIRYREGAIVSSSGEKYIIQKPPEYDGGSRGKVYTKGKRGKGFV